MKLRTANIVLFLLCFCALVNSVLVAMQFKTDFPSDVLKLKGRRLDDSDVNTLSQKFPDGEFVAWGLSLPKNKQGAQYAEDNLIVQSSFSVGKTTIYMSKDGTVIGSLVDSPKADLFSTILNCTATIIAFVLMTKQKSPRA